MLGGKYETAERSIGKALKIMFRIQFTIYELVMMTECMTLRVMSSKK
jgi:hypothetical protein